MRLPIAPSLRGRGRARRSALAAVCAAAVLAALSGCRPSPVMLPESDGSWRTDDSPRGARARSGASSSAPVQPSDAGPSAPPAPADRGTAPEGRKTPELAASQIAATLQTMSQLRGLAIRRPVVGTVLNRDAVLARIVAKVERNLPPEALQAQAELLAALELIPADYDFVAGIYSILKENVAGFYDPEDGAMVLLDDLDEASSAETLAHELVHALQDQHYVMEPLMRYRPHDSDRVAAVQILSEGDATSAMFEQSTGSAFNITDSVLRLALAASTAFSPSGPDTPRLLHLALVAPYVDGFAFVQQLRLRGGWAEVDAAWRRLPTTTEQLLHLDKFDAREPPIDVGVPELGPLGPGWSVLDHDVLGEQGLRIALEVWADRATATAAAAGWGGDRYVVARRPASSREPGAAAATAAPASSGQQEVELATAWIIRFDTVKDAAELAALLRGPLGTQCKERPLLGARLWLARGDTVVLAAGPYRRDAAGKRLPSDLGCTKLRAWAAALAGGIRR